MPRPSREPSHAQTAATLLQEARNPKIDAEAAAARRQEASVEAMLAIAEQLSEIRSEIIGVAGALQDSNGYGAGDHLHYISDWLEKISKK